MRAALHETILMSSTDKGLSAKCQPRRTHSLGLFRQVSKPGKSASGAGSWTVAALQRQGLPRALAANAVCLDLGASYTGMLPGKNSFLRISVGIMLSSRKILISSSLLVFLYFTFAIVTHTVFIAYR